MSLMTCWPGHGRNKKMATKTAPCKHCRGKGESWQKTPGGGKRRSKCLRCSGDGFIEYETLGGVKPNA